MKNCSKCKKLKPIEMFGQDKRTKSGATAECRDCRNIERIKWREANGTEPYNKKYRLANRDRILIYHRKSHLEKRYGITTEDYDRMLLQQNGLCAICRKPDKKILCVDHNHTTGKVRGLLCDKHNKALGGFSDNIELLKNAIAYLVKYD